MAGVFRGQVCVTDYQTVETAVTRDRNATHPAYRTLALTCVIQPLQAQSVLVKTVSLLKMMDLIVEILTNVLSYKFVLKIVLILQDHSFVLVCQVMLLLHPD